MTDISEEDIHRMIGVVSVNGLDVNVGDSDHGELIGFYPVFSNINHACLANTKPVKVTIHLMSHHQCSCDG